MGALLEREAAAVGSTGGTTPNCDMVVMFQGERTLSVLIPDGVGGDMGYFMKGV